MSQVRVAIVCPDDSLRMLAAQAFDHAPPDWDVSLHREVTGSAEVVVSVGCRLPDAIQFDPTRPADVLEAIKEHLAQRNRRLVIVVGASGGCGATSLALHLAAAATGDRCLLAGDPRPLAYRLGLEPALLRSGPVPVPGGFKIGSLRAIDALAGRFDAVVADAGPAAFAAVAPRGDACVLVLNPTVPSARAAADLLEAYPDQVWAVVTNRLGPGGETNSAELQGILGRRICLELPCSRGLRDAESEIRLLSGWSPWLQRVGRLAKALGLR